MKKNIMVVIALSMLIGFLPAYSSPLGLKVGGSVNYYTISDSLFKDLYGNGHFMFGGYMSFEIFEKYEIRGEANYFRDTGEMPITQEEIKFTFVPIVLGIRYRILKVSIISPYLGAGVDFISYKEDVPDRFEDVSESTTGYHVEAGSYINMTGRFYIDLNFRYIKADVEPFDETVKLGGFRAGLGFGIAF
ncbi:MAG: porin family protein [Candidatus Aminicenantes bacterium]|nr:porin family protein [Candidatus Aminicenantes bacterium]